jgi:phage terminase large subunit-like protein
VANWQGDPEERLREIIAQNIQKQVLRPRWKPLPHQVPPPGDDWYGWMLLAGRGAGKTDACSNYMVRHVNGPPCLPGPTPHWMAIIAPTLGDAATACFAGPSGIHTYSPEAQMQSKPGGLLITWPNGSQAKMFGTRDPDDIERLRAGGNVCLVWAEEMAAWRYLKDAWDQFRFGLRIGKHPRWIGSTTPKPRPLIKKLAKGDYRNVVLTYATMYDNPYLPQSVKDDLEEAYAGTTIGAQELYGRLVEQDENALFTRANLNDNRLTVAPGWMNKIAVGVDPSGGAGEQGIVVVGSGQIITAESKGRPTKHGFVLKDATVHTNPEGWGRAAVQTAVDWEANAVIVETNFGGDMAVSTITTAAEHMGVPIPVKTVHASRGKSPRAQPVSAMAVQGRWHMVNEHPELEDQLCTWVDSSDWSPDRLDAMVWPAWYMKLVSTIFKAVGSFGGSQMAHRRLTRRPQ